VSDSQAQAYLEHGFAAFAARGAPQQVAVDLLRDTMNEADTVHPQMVFLVPFADGSWIVSTRNPDDLAHCGAQAVESADALTEALGEFGNRAGGEGLEQAVIAVPRGMIADAARSSEPLTLEQLTAYSEQGDTGDCASCPIRHICPEAREGRILPVPTADPMDMIRQAVNVERLLGDMRIELD